MSTESEKSIFFSPEFQQRSQMEIAYYGHPVLWRARSNFNDWTSPWSESKKKVIELGLQHAKLVKQLHGIQP